MSQPAAASKSKPSCHFEASAGKSDGKMRSDHRRADPEKRHFRFLPQRQRGHFLDFSRVSAGLKLKSNSRVFCVCQSESRPGANLKVYHLSPARK